MRLRDEAADPWGLLFAGLSGGLAVAVGIPAAAAVGIGAAVFGVKVAAGLVTRGRRSRVEPARVLPVRRGSLEEGWLDRARAAERAFAEVAASASPGPVAARVGGFGSQAEQALASIRRLAGQVSAVGSALRRIDARRLLAERDRLRRAIDSHRDARVRREQERSLASIVAQLETYDRLVAAQSALLARIESGTLGLEGLVARLAEVVALVETTIASTDGASAVESLAEELDGLRTGLVEAEDVSQRTLSGVGVLPVGGPGTVAGPRTRRGRSQAYPPR